MQLWLIWREYSWVRCRTCSMATSIHCTIVPYINFNASPWFYILVANLRTAKSSNFSWSRYKVVQKSASAIFVLTSSTLWNDDHLHTSKSMVILSPEVYQQLSLSGQETKLAILIVIHHLLQSIAASQVVRQISLTPYPCGIHHLSNANQRSIVDKTLGFSLHLISMELNISPISSMLKYL